MLYTPNLSVLFINEDIKVFRGLDAWIMLLEIDMDHMTDAFDEVLSDRQSKCHKSTLHWQI